MENMIVPLIVASVYLFIEIFKMITKNNEKFLKLIPVIAGSLGIVFAVITFYVAPSVLPVKNLFIAIMVGISSGLAATGTNQIFKQLTKCDKTDDTNKK